MNNKYRILIISIVMIAISIILYKSFNDERIQKQPKNIKILGDLAYEQYRTDKCIVYIEDNDKLNPFIVLTNNYNKEKSTLVLRKETLTTSQYNKKYGYYNGSTVDLYLNNEYLSKIPSKLQNKIINTNIKINQEGAESKIDATTETISRKIFLLAYNEVCNEHTSVCCKEGKLLRYFKDDTEHLAAYNNGRIQDWWLRSSCTWNGYEAFFVVGNERLGADQVSYIHSVRPAFCLSSDIPVQEDTLDGKKIYKLVIN